MFNHQLVSTYLWPHGLQHAGLPCPSLSPRISSHSSPLSQWCHPTISSSVGPFSSCLQSFPASESLPMSQLFASGGQYWSFSFCISNSNEYSELISFRMDWFKHFGVQFSSVQSLSRVWLFVTPCTAAHLASLSITNSWSLLKLMSIESVMTADSQHQGLFQWVNSSHEVHKVLEFQLHHQSFQWTPRTDFLQDGLVVSSCSPRDSQESSPTP